MNFATSVGVARLEDKLGGAITSFNLEIRIHCADCGQKFQFPRLEPDMDREGARCSLDGLEAGIATSPEGLRPNPSRRQRQSLRSQIHALSAHAEEGGAHFTGVRVERLQGIT